MLLKGHNNSVAGKADRRITRAACWQSSGLVAFGFYPSTPASSLTALMLEDKGQQPRIAESLVGGYLFNHHR